MFKRFLLFLSFCLLTIGSALGQNITVKGTVLDENNEAVIGATVRLKDDPTKGAITDIDGNFTLQARSGQIILVTYVGYKNVEIAAAPSLTIRLVPDDELLDEVIVVGYGTSTKRSFTGSAVTVNSEALEKKSISNVSAALSGEVPGVNVVNSSGQPGSSSAIYVRGVGSVNASTAPLYVVDGVPYDGAISSLNPNDIESTTLLKDAASTAIYGARGANGVILITTKSGKSGKLSVSGDFKYGFNTFKFIPRHEVLTDPDEYLEMAYSSMKMTGTYDDTPVDDPETPDIDESLYDDPTAYANQYIFSEAGINPKYNYYNETDASKIFDENGKIRPGLQRRYTPESWEAEGFQPSARMEGNIQVAGGSDKIKGFASFGYLNDRGIFKNSDFTRYSTRTNLDLTPKEWLQLKTNFSYTHSQTNAAGQSGAAEDILNFVNNMPPIYPVYARDEQGNKTLSPYYQGQYEFDYGEGRGFSGMTNGIASAIFDRVYGKTDELTYNASAIIRFLDGFTFENTYSGLYSGSTSNSLNNPWYGSESAQNGVINKSYTRAYTNNMLSLLRYNKQFEGGHNLEAFIAHESHFFTATYDGATKQGTVDPFNDDLSNAVNQDFPSWGYTEDYRMESYFAQANYDYMNKYFLSGTFRYDGSSRFKNNKWGPFGSVGAAWVLSSEDFLKGNDVLTFAKLKASWGTLGQQGGINYYSGDDLYSVGVVEKRPVLSFQTKGNPDLTWERSNMFQVGAELQFAKVLDLNIELYDKRTTDLIYERRVAPSNGYALYNVNDGLLENYGADIDLTWRAVTGKDYYFTVRANAGFVGNKMLRLPIEPSTGEPKFFDESMSPWGRKEGKSLYDYYIRSFEGVNPDTGLSEWKVFYLDNDGDGKYTPGSTDVNVESYEDFAYKNPDQVKNLKEGTTTQYTKATRYDVGKSALPVVRGGVTLAGGWKGIEASVQFIYGIGGWGYDSVYASLMHNQKVGNNNWHVDMRNRWMQPGDVTDVPRLNNDADLYVNGTSTRFLTSNSFLNFSNFMLSYTLPQAWTNDVLKINSVKFWVSGDNLFLISARKGFNPSTSLTGGNSVYSYNPLSTITGGVRISF